MKKLFLFLFLSSILSYAQLFEDKDIEICNSKFELAVKNELSSKPINEVIAEIGKSFLGVDYEAFAIEREGEEQLVIHLSGLDCTTFLENCLVIARCIKSNRTTFDDYLKEFTNLRYRDGVIDRYPSRLHYFSDWVFNNSAKGIVKDITKEIGGEPIQFNVGFMSKNPDKYKHLKEQPEFISIIKKQEEEINQRTYYFIPREKVAELENQIQNGDLIAITTNIDGLDVGHVGIAVKTDGGRVAFMHAPLVGSKVQITEVPLPEYLAKIKKHTGIIVLRPQEP
jgi:hypothetical protein